jgi:hypothetical protein
LFCSTFGWGAGSRLQRQTDKLNEDNQECQAITPEY